ncbi:MAG TPA: RNA polymerase sigma factor [Mycobacteriales bacterium]|jgi:RNA polymerase sigma-70 factor (ECF subfamily)|nr:RNA polymerase sigma factor [Mycobacteriales bacterium]
MRAGADGEFADWVSPHVVAMSRLAARLAPDGDRDDIVQESLVRAWRKRSTYDDARGSVLTWLLAIVADQCRRSRVRSRPTTSLVDSPVTDSPADVDLERGLLRLSERQRLAVSLHYFVGLSVRECADVMRCSEGTVKSTLYDARTRLRAALEVRA